MAAGDPVPDRRIFAETYFPRIHFGWSELRSLLDGRWHYIEGPRPEFFDLASDRGEKSNLIEGRPPAFRAMRLEMEKLHATFRAPGNVDEEAARKLASLGYLGSGESAGNGPLDDPKDHIAAFQKLKDALDHLTEGRPAKAAETAGALLAENPRMLDLWDLRSLALTRLGRKDEALAALKRMVELAPPGSTHYLRLVANRCLDLGNAVEAIRHAEAAKGLGDRATDEILARALLAKGDLDGAEAAARASLAFAPNRNRGALVLSRIAVRRNDLPRALDLLKATDGGNPGGRTALPGLHSLRGDILARMSRHREAEAEFREEIRLHPATFAAWSSLVVLYAAQNRPADVKTTVEEMIAASPGVDAYLAAFQTLSILGDRAGADRWRREGLRRFPEEPRFRRAPRPA